MRRDKTVQSKARNTNQSMNQQRKGIAFGDQKSSVAVRTCEWRRPKKESAGGACSCTYYGIFRYSNPCIDNIPNAKSHSIKLLRPETSLPQALCVEAAC